MNNRSYMSFKYFNSKLLEKYKDLAPIEIRCTFQYYNGVDDEYNTYNTIVYYKKDSDIFSIYNGKGNFRKEYIDGVLFLDFYDNYKAYNSIKKYAIFRFKDEIEDVPIDTYLCEGNCYLLKNGEYLLVDNNGINGGNYELYKYLRNIVSEIYNLSLDKKREILTYYKEIKRKICMGQKLSKEEYLVISNLMDQDFNKKCNDLSVLKLSLEKEKDL